MTLSKMWVKSKQRGYTTATAIGLPRLCVYTYNTLLYSNFDFVCFPLFHFSNRLFSVSTDFLDISLVFHRCFPTHFTHICEKSGENPKKFTRIFHRFCAFFPRACGNLYSFPFFPFFIHRFSKFFLCPQTLAEKAFGEFSTVSTAPTTTTKK